MSKITNMKEGQIIEFHKPKKFEFVKALSAGGTGKTILMRDLTINEQFVCKKYDPEQKEYEEEFFERFVDEIKIMYSIYDRNIVRIYDYFLYPEYKTGYIIMEYIQGDDIDDYFLWEDNEKINSVFVQIINAFTYLAKKGILHRDVRSANIMIDSTDNVKIIDFGFGKKLNVEKADGQSDEQASVILNWPASKIPLEIWKEVYNEKTEIFYVGYLIKNLIDKYEMDCFKYDVLLEKMICVNPNERIESFEAIQKSIAEQTFDDVQFTKEQKEIYQGFAFALCESVKIIKYELTLEDDQSVIIEKLRVVLRDNSLERYISNPNHLISCFIKSNYTYYRNTEIYVSVVKKFYEFFVSQTEALRSVILNNLYGRLGKIPIESTLYDDELPFN